MGRVTRCDIIIVTLLWSGTWNAPMDKLNTWSAELSACSVLIPFAYVRYFGGSAINNTQRRSSISIPTTKHSYVILNCSNATLKRGKRRPYEQ